jgi:hypothetical protein
LAWDGWESILGRPVFADLGREVRFRSGPRAADATRGRAVDPRRAAGARPRGGKHRRPGASSLPVPLHLPLQAGHEPAGADLGSRSVDVAQRSRSPARLRESAGGHESSVRAAAPGPERSADAQGRRGADAGPARPLHGRRAEHAKSHAAGWRRRGAVADYPLWKQNLVPSGYLTNI